jgi:hypothetical protein
VGVKFLGLRFAIWFSGIENGAQKLIVDRKLDWNTQMQTVDVNIIHKQIIVVHNYWGWQDIQKVQHHLQTELWQWFQ